MSTSPPGGQTIAEAPAIERELTRLLLRYAHCVDRRDFDGIGACYWPDAIDEHATFHGDALAYVRWLREVLPPIAVSSHQFTNILVDVHTPDDATSETYCLNVNVFAAPAADGRERQTTALLRYLDRFERRAGEWRIAHRRVITDWSREELVRPMVR